MDGICYDPFTMQYANCANNTGHGAAQETFYVIVGLFFLIAAGVFAWIASHLNTVLKLQTQGDMVVASPSTTQSLYSVSVFFGFLSLLGLIYTIVMIIMPSSHSHTTAAKTGIVEIGQQQAYYYGAPNVQQFPPQAYAAQAYYQPQAYQAYQPQAYQAYQAYSAAPAVQAAAATAPQLPAATAPSVAKAATAPAVTVPTLGGFRAGTEATLARFG
jgi:hypothetical protein